MERDSPAEFREGRGPPGTPKAQSLGHSHPEKAEPHGNAAQTGEERGMTRRERRL